MDALQPEATFTHIPKAELHLHLGGSFPVDYLYSVATPEETKALDEGLSWISRGVSYKDCFRVFSLVSQIINSEKRVEDGTAALCEELEKDNVVYAEIRTGLKDLGKGYEEYLLSVLRGIEKSRSDHFDARVLLSLQRSSTPDYAKMSVDFALKYKERGVVGIDISGDATIGEIEVILPELFRAKQEGLFLAMHIGETPPLMYKQREILEMLKPDRIGHAVHLEKSALEWILEHKTPIEVCLTSSEVVMMVENYAMHPGLMYYRQGHPVTICTDDPLIFRTTMSEELAKLHKSGLFSLEEVEQVARESLNYAFIPEEEKQALRRP